MLKPASTPSKIQTVKQRCSEKINFVTDCTLHWECALGVEVGRAELFRASGCNFMSRSGFGSGRADLKLLESGFGL